MSLQNFIIPIKIRVIVYYICKLLKLLSAILIVPLVVSIINGDFLYTLLFGVLSLVSLAAGFLGEKIGNKSLDKKEAIVVTALSYLIFSLISAFAFLPETNYLNGFFEAISGFTTTGLSVLNVEFLPDTLIFFRSYSQWIGGAGIIIITLVIFINPGSSASQLYSSEFSKENLVGNVRNTGLIVIKIYLAFTLAGYIIYVITGIGFFDSLIFAMSTFSTGGFSSHSTSAGYYNLPLFNIALIFFMMLGATPFSTTYNITQKGLKGFSNYFELKYMLLFLFLSSILFYAAWGFRTDKIISSLFHSASAITTTGFSIEKSSEWTPGIKLLKIFLMIIGGSSESTAGGIKIIRFILIIYLFRWVILKLLLPEEAKVPIRIGNYSFKNTEIKKTASYFAVYIFIIFLSTFAFLYYGYNVIDSIFECSSALGTVGLSTGITDGNMPALLKVVLIIEMWAGRLEIFPLLALFYPFMWVKIGDSK